jgi:hypothetical protein
MRALATAIIALGFFAMLAQTALAAESEALTARSDQQKKEDEEVDKAYRAATRGDKGPAAKVDPWATVRPADSDSKNRH